MQGERTGQYWDLDEAAWVAVDGESRPPAEQVAEELAVLDATPATSERT